MTNTPQDKDVTAYATAELMALPALVQAAEQALSDLGQSMKAIKVSLSEAELDAQLNAPVDAKNAEGRKLQLEAAVTNSDIVQGLRGTLAGTEAQYAAAEVDYNAFHRRWKTALALAELQAAKIRYLATFDKKQ